METDLARHAGADRNREVDAGHGRHVLIADDGRDPCALLGRELGASASLTGGLGAFFLLRAGGVFTAVTVAAFGFRVAVTRLVLGLHVLGRGALFILRAVALGFVAPWGFLGGFLSRFLAGRFLAH